MEKGMIFKDNGGRRTLEERRMSDISINFDERRVNKDRRDSLDRRSGKDRRSFSGFRALAGSDRRKVWAAALSLRI